MTDEQNTLRGFDAVLDTPAPDPRNTVLVFPLDADGEPTEEALRQFAAIINAADQAQKEQAQ
jgi:hypothetical protein